MRMKRLRHLEERLLECRDILFISETDELNFQKASDVKEYIDLDKWFGKERPVWLEIGCGKGKFACELALQNPEKNIIAIEKNSSVIVQACEAAETARIPNLRFIKCSAEYITKYLKPSSVERIYLNFSCPYPKKSYSRHRLTAKPFLERYRELMADGAEIHQKTDNRGLFEFSIEQFSNAGFALKNVSLDLHHSEFTGNIVTEYESKFVALGLPIYRLEAYIKK